MDRTLPLTVPLLIWTPSISPRSSVMPLPTNGTMVRLPTCHTDKTALLLPAFLSTSTSLRSYGRAPPRLDVPPFNAELVPSFPTTACTLVSTFYALQGSLLTNNQSATTQRPATFSDLLHLRSPSQSVSPVSPPTSRKRSSILCNMTRAF